MNSRSCPSLTVHRSSLRDVPHSLTPIRTNWPQNLDARPHWSYDPARARAQQQVYRRSTADALTQRAIQSIIDSL